MDVTRLLYAGASYGTLWIACVLFLAPLRHRTFCRLRVLLALGAGCVFVLVSALPFPRIGPLELVVHYLFAAAVLWFCGDMNLASALYCGAWAVICQRLCTEVWVLCRVGGRELSWLQGHWWLVAGAIFVVGYGVVGLTIARWMPAGGRYLIGPRQLTSALVLLGIFEVLFLILTSEGVLSDGLYFVVILLAQCYCATALYLQDVLFQKSAMRQELMTMNLLWRQSWAQYDLAKENIDLINRKCHDLKHQMRALKTIAGTKEREQYVSELEKSIQIYDSIVKTGNEALDIILTEKSLYCEANHIQVNCVADGSRLGFVNPVDLYAIFGNALSNAIESVQHIQAPGRRVIDVLVYAKQQFLAVSITNPLDSEGLKFEGGLPVSTKPKNGFHGFGLKSIRHTAEKYGGFVTVDAENGSFSLRILFPLSVE